MIRAAPIRAPGRATFLAVAVVVCLCADGLVSLVVAAVPNRSPSTLSSPVAVPLVRIDRSLGAPIPVSVEAVAAVERIVRHDVLRQDDHARPVTLRSVFTKSLILRLGAGIVAFCGVVAALLGMGWEARLRRRSQRLPLRRYPHPGLIKAVRPVTEAALPVTDAAVAAGD